MNDVVMWNADKPHRCPSCHASTVTIERPRERVVYTCCRCGTRFSSDPNNETETAGVMCAEHMARSV
jgi:ribosomal protein L37AE/L43A